MIEKIKSLDDRKNVTKIVKNCRRNLKKFDIDFGKK